MSVVCVCVGACEREREWVVVPGGSVMDTHTHTKRGRGRGRRGREVDKAPRVVVDVSAYNYQVYPGGKSISCQWTDIYRNQPQKRKEEKNKAKVVATDFLPIRTLLKISWVFFYKDLNSGLSSTYIKSRLEH